MHKPRSIILFFCLCAFIGFSQHAARIDSLKNKLKEDLADTLRVQAMKALATTYNRSGDFKAGQKCALENLALAQKIDYRRALGGIYTDLANATEHLSDYPRALSYNRLSLTSYLEFKNKKGAAACYNNIGIIYYNLADYPKCLEYFQKSLKMQEEVGNRYAVAATTGNIAVIYELLKEDSLSMVCQQKSFDIHKEMGNRSDMAASLGNLGNLYKKKKNFDKAGELFNQSLKIFLEMNEKQGLIESYSNLGTLFMEREKPNEALEMYLKSKELSEEMGNKKNLSGIYILLAGAYEKKGDVDQAVDFFKKAFDIAKSVGNLKEEKEAADGLYSCYNKKSDFKNALFYNVIARSLNDSIFNSSKNESLNSLKTQFALDRQEFDLNTKAEKEKEKQEEEKNKQRVVMYVALGVLILVLIFSYFLYQRFQLTNSQKKVIENQKVMVEQKNKEITDSIMYAKRLQQAIIPPVEHVRDHFPESFIYFQPKDIVAGDFYWMEIVSSGKKEDELILIAVGDCTGHGVPGAMVSVVCSNALNRSVKEFNLIDPGKILDKTRELVLETFEKSGEEIKDGMDISLASISKNDAKDLINIKWSGANNALWYLDENELRTIKPDKQAIGQTDDPKPFSTHSLQLKKGSQLYLFTDGYADQFGGPKGKKFKYKQINEILLQNAAKPLDLQKEALESAFEAWKGNLEQIDDVTILGIRL